LSRSQILENLGRLAPTKLAELDSAAALLTRRDRKYIVPLSVATQFLDRLGESSRVLEIDGRRLFRYESIYFDTPEGSSYLAAAWRRPRRFKVRIRSYLDQGRCLLEIKTRDRRGRTVKERREHPIEIASRLDAADLTFLGACPTLADGGRTLEPVLTTQYGRSTLLIGEPAVRATIDLDIEALAPDGRSVGLDAMTIVETKTAGPPSEADRVLWSMGHRPIKVSKFCTSLAALRPDLPSNRWRRALGHPWLTNDLRTPERATPDRPVALAS
jgi:hypothetical protein